MRGSKLELVKQAIKFMVQQLSGTDRLSVVSFDAQVQDTYGDALNMNFMTSGNKKVATACIDRIQAGGGTNLSAGLFRAIDHHQQQPSASDSHARAEQRVKSVFIFTDGISSVGVTHRSQLIAVLKAMLQTSGSLKIHTFGFGSVYDEQTLLGISEEGGGHCMYIQDAEAIPAAFATSLGGLMSVVKQNLELTFAPQAGVRIKDIDTSFRKTCQPDGSITVAIGDLYAGEQKDLLLRLELPQISTPVDQFPVLSLEARYLDISNACMQSLQLAVTIPRTRSPLASQSRNHFVLQHVQRCETSSALQAASEMADMGNLSGARQLLAATEANVMQRHVNASSASYAADLRTTLDAFESRESYQSVGRVLSHSLGQEHSRQQTSYLGSGRAPMYQSITGQTMYQTVTEVNHDIVSNDSQTDSGSKGSHDDDWQYVQGRPDGEARSAVPRNTEVASYSNTHSTTSTLNYEQVSSGAKRKHGHLVCGTQHSVTQAPEGAEYSTHAKMHRGKK